MAVESQLTAFLSDPSAPSSPKALYALWAAVRKEAQGSADFPAADYLARAQGGVQLALASAQLPPRSEAHRTLLSCLFSLRIYAGDALRYRLALAPPPPSAAAPPPLLALLEHYYTAALTDYALGGGALALPGGSGHAHNQLRLVCEDSPPLALYHALRSCAAPVPFRQCREIATHLFSALLSSAAAQGGSSAGSGHGCGSVVQGWCRALAAPWLPPMEPRRHQAARPLQGSAAAHAWPRLLSALTRDTRRALSYSASLPCPRMSLPGGGGASPQAKGAQQLSPAWALRLALACMAVAHESCREEKGQAAEAGGQEVQNREGEEGGAGQSHAENAAFSSSPSSSSSSSCAGGGGGGASSVYPLEALQRSSSSAAKAKAASLVYCFTAAMSSSISRLLWEGLKKAPLKQKFGKSAAGRGQSGGAGSCGEGEGGKGDHALGLGDHPAAAEEKEEKEKEEEEEEEEGGGSGGGQGEGAKGSLLHPRHRNGQQPPLERRRGMPSSPPPPPPPTAHAALASPLLSTLRYLLAFLSHKSWHALDGPPASAWKPLGEATGAAPCIFAASAAHYRRKALASLGTLKKALEGCLAVAPLAPPSSGGGATTSAIPSAPCVHFLEDLEVHGFSPLVLAGATPLSSPTTPPTPAMMHALAVTAYACLAATTALSPGAHAPLCSAFPNARFLLHLPHSDARRASEALVWQAFSTRALALLGVARAAPSPPPSHTPAALPAPPVAAAAAANAAAAGPRGTKRPAAEFWVAPRKRHKGGARI